MHQKLLVSKYTAVIQLIYGYLTRAVSIYARSQKNKYIEKNNIPLSKGKSDIKISYISGIAFHFSKSHNSQTFSIANLIASYIPAELTAYFTVEVLPSGLIQIQVTDSLLAIWLQSFINENGSVEANLVNFKAKIDNLSDCIFSIQYVHARCYSLLKLAQQEKLIDFNINSNKYSSQPIPWLKSDGQLRLNHQAERYLIANLVRIVDELQPVIARPIKWEGAALSLVRAFEDFCKACRIHDDLKTTAPELVMARIGLLMVTQSVLKFLLEEKLGISAWLEL
ncbi:MAG: DALR anticodon-binding domain-containing protein [Rivularia sp. (in: cyanobacteria)]